MPPGDRVLPCETALQEGWRVVKSLGKYDILRQIGHGGMGELYLARARGIAGFEKLCAIKCLLPHLARDASSRRMFLNEARLTACLDHPNVVHVHEVGEEDGQLYLVMEYVPGADLDKLLSRCA